MVFLEKYYALLLMAHLLVTFVLVGSVTHNLIVVGGYLRGKFARQKLELRYARVGFWSYVIVYITGALVYPAFRVYIRGELFDPMRWPTGLFEVKEHWGAVGLAMFGVYYFLRKSFQPDQEKQKLWLHVPLCIMINIVVWYKVIAGCYLSNLKGSW